MFEGVFKNAFFLVIVLGTLVVQLALIEIKDYLHIYMCMHACMCVCVYIYIHTHTHTYAYVYIGTLVVQFALIEIKGLNTAFGCTNLTKDQWIACVSPF